MNFSTGSIVRARGREWVVLPQGDDASLIIVKPLGGHEAEVTGILPSLESVSAASFAPPDPEQVGDWTSGRLLREAARISTRNATGAIRCWSRIDVDPRPYQLVPLLMALRMETVRMLIADDVGIGKTVEALLIAREMWDRGDIRRLTVLAPPALVDQWVEEMDTKFHLEAVPVLAGTAARLERSIGASQSLFDVYPITVVSLDFIKAEKRRNEFVRSCPELVIVDEAHACAPGIGVRQQRFRLLQELSADLSRHIVLVTATPHSGKASAFESLVGLLTPDIKAKADTGQPAADLLAKCFVQRRRPDIRRYLETDTAFPERKEREESYTFSEPYRKLFQKATEWANASFEGVQIGTRQHRVRWWSALALLRALSSSPRAAETTLRTRAQVQDAASSEEADEIGARTVLDQEVIETADGADLVAGSEDSDAETAGSDGRKKLLDLARVASRITPQEDTKLQLAVRELKKLLTEGFSPIVFCRFIETAEYVTENVRAAFAKDPSFRDKPVVVCITGELDPDDRRERIDAIPKDKPRILVATDCLSEGINLQDRFTAVVHYDLSWNPTRHEQREGRVDRFGQRAREVRALSLYGSDNPIDGIVLDVLLRKHKQIRTDLGVSIPVPTDANDVLTAIMEGLDFRAAWRRHDGQLELDLGHDLLIRRNRLHQEWESSAERQKESRTRFAQRTVQPDEVSRELAELRAAAGDAVTVRWFSENALKRLGATVIASVSSLKIIPAALPVFVREQLGINDQMVIGFDDKAPDDAPIVGRSHPLIAALSAYVIETALDSAGSKSPVASRCGVVRTDRVERRTTVILARFRFDITTGRGEQAHVDLGEEIGAIAFRDAKTGEDLLSGSEAESLFDLPPAENITPDIAKEMIRKIIGGLKTREDALMAEAQRRAALQTESLRRVREAVRLKGAGGSVQPRGEPDILGVYVYLPSGGTK
jgi:superfamily II DNA or RNA helicase